MISPRNSTLGEEIYREIDKNEYLHELYDAILNNYSVKLLNLPHEDMVSINVDDALRFADILSKSAGVPDSEKHKAWAQEIVALLGSLYPGDPKIEHYTASVLSTIGNYRGLQLVKTAHQSDSFLESLFAGFDMDYLSVPYQQDKYFFHSQKAIYDRLDDPTFSYSGPTSMGKSLLMRMFIKDRIVSGKEENFAIIVPTKALISEITSSIIQDLKTLLEEKNYKVVNSAGALMLNQPHNFIFVLTPERLLYLLISNPEININYLFVDEAHKISANDGRSAFYYKVVDMLSERPIKPHVIFASPNIPNPEVYLKLVPDIESKKDFALATSFSPVSQLRYMVDTVERKVMLYNERKKAMLPIVGLKPRVTPLDIIKNITANSPNKQSIVYFNSKDKAIDMARRYAVGLIPKGDPMLESLAKEIKNEIHDTYYLAELIRCGVAYHVGYLPNHIRTSIEKCFREHKIDILFCTSTLVEGVNLPADNLFIMSYKNGTHNMTPVDFRNLIGRVGRIEYNLYGNVFILRYDPNQKQDKFQELIEKDIPEQKISLVSELTKNQKERIVETLLAGNIEFQKYPSNQTEDGYSLMRKFGLILLRDITKGRNSPVKEAFSSLLTPEKEDVIRQHFLAANARTQPDDDINISVDQTETLTAAIERGLTYPELKNGSFDYDEMVVFLTRLCHIFKWGVYERKTLGHVSSKDGTYANLRWYATVLIQWMEGNGLNTIIKEAIRYKQTHYDSTVKINGEIIPYNDTRLHKNAVIAETLTIIDNVILFSIANYFLRFSTEYKNQHGVENFDNDWYEYVEYGSTNPLTIMLQRNGFSRETSEYIKQNKNKYVVDTELGPRLLISILDCPKESVKNEVADIQFNVPELFIEDWMA